MIVTKITINEKILFVDLLSPALFTERRSSIDIEGNIYIYIQKLFATLSTTVKGGIRNYLKIYSWSCKCKSILFFFFHFKSFKIKILFLI